MVRRDVNEPREAFDLVVVGAGVAGWTAARRAQQLRLRVAVLERRPEGPGGGNGRISGGYLHAAYLDPRRPALELERAITSATDGFARPEVARSWAEHSAAGMAFLESEGARFAPLAEPEWLGNVLQPYYDSRPEPGIVERWRGAGPDLLLTAMWRAFVAAGGDFQPGAPATDLLVDGGAVTGVAVSGGSGTRRVRGRAVLLADGGFHSNRELARTHFGSDRFLLRASGDNQGDCLRMAVALGAATHELDAVYAHLHHRDSLHDDRLWPRLSVDLLCEACLVLTAAGRRLGAQDPSFMHLAHEIIRSESPEGCWLVMDGAAWHGLGRQGELPPNPTFMELGARVVEAGRPEELAAAIGVRPRRLREEIERFNADAARPAAPPPLAEGVPHPLPARIRFRGSATYALPIVVGVTFGMGGVLVDGRAQVLDREGRPILGLLAAGGVMGGLQGGRRHGYAGGWSQAVNYGLVAAERAAELGGTGPARR